MEKYLQASMYIDWNDKPVLSRAQRLARGVDDPMQVAKACFAFVRDEIKHSGDHELNPVTCKASDVLKHGTGFCYAKSHLLAALLRANGIPAGLCYQRLTVDNSVRPFCLHGLNAVFLDDHGWYRIDARGNRPGVEARFSPPIERLAFRPTRAGETDLPEIWPEPLPAVVRVLENSSDYQQVADNLPDIEST